MIEENKLSDSNESELELGSESGDENVSDNETSTDTPEGSELKKLKELTGKDFKSADDFKKHYENLKSFSGTEEAQEIRKKAKLYDEIQKEANGVLNELDKDQKKGIPDKVDGDKSEIDKLNDKFEKSEFLRENPDAKEHFSLVEAVADKGKIPFQKAWDETVKDLAAAKSEKDKEHSDIIDSKSKTAPIDTQKVNQLAEQVKKTDSFEDKQKLVEGILGQSE